MKLYSCDLMLLIIPALFYIGYIIDNSMVSILAFGIMTFLFFVWVIARIKINIRNKIIGYAMKVGNTALNNFGGLKE